MFPICGPWTIGSIVPIITSRTDLINQVSRLSLIFVFQKIHCLLLMFSFLKDTWFSFFFFLFIHSFVHSCVRSFVRSFIQIFFSFSSSSTCSRTLEHPRTHDPSIGPEEGARCRNARGESVGTKRAEGNPQKLLTATMACSDFKKILGRFTITFTPLHSTPVPT